MSHTEALFSVLQHAFDNLLNLSVELFPVDQSESSTCTESQELENLKKIQEKQLEELLQEDSRGNDGANDKDKLEEFDENKESEETGRNSLTSSQQLAQIQIITEEIVNEESVIIDSVSIEIFLDEEVILQKKIVEDQIKQIGRDKKRKQKELEQKLEEIEKLFLLEQVELNLDHLDIVTPLIEEDIILELNELPIPYHTIGQETKEIPNNEENKLEIDKAENQLILKNEKNIEKEGKNYEKNIEKNIEKNLENQEENKDSEDEGEGRQLTLSEVFAKQEQLWKRNNESKSKSRQLRMSMGLRSGTLKLLEAEHLEKRLHRRESWSILQSEITNSKIPVADVQTSVNEQKKLMKKKKKKNLLLLNVTMVMGEDLPKYLDITSTFCRIYFNDSISYQTKTKFNSKLPHWNDSFEVDIPNEKIPSLKIELWNVLTHNRTELLGVGFLPIPTKGNVREEKILWVDIHSPSGNAKENSIVALSTHESTGRSLGQSGGTSISSKLGHSHDKSLQSSQSGSNQSNANQVARIKVKYSIFESEIHCKTLISLLLSDPLLTVYSYQLLEASKQEAPAFSFVDLLNNQDNASFLTYVIDYQSNVDHLLSKNSILRKMIALYFTYSRGNFIDDYIFPILQTIEDNQIQLEVRKSYLLAEGMSEEEANEKCEKNKSTLEHTILRIIESVYKSIYDLPENVIALLQQIYHKIKIHCTNANSSESPDKGDESGDKKAEPVDYRQLIREALGDLLFNKLIGPVIASPGRFGLLQNYPSPPVNDNPPPPGSAHLLRQQSIDCSNNPLEDFRSANYIILTKFMVNLSMNHLFPPENELSILN